MSHPYTRLAAVAVLAAVASAVAPSGQVAAAPRPAVPVAMRGTAPAAEPAGRVAPPVTRRVARRVAPPAVVAAHPAWRPGQYRYRTVEAAMRAVARAYNRHDRATLRSLANPSAVDGLEEMRREASDLRLLSCGEQRGFGLMCSFSHGFPATLHRAGRGRASMQPAYDAKHGWYLAGTVECD
jgi:predicted lipid-binding transport protein (Tim44 family)